MTQTIEQLIAELRDEEIHTFDGFTVADVLEQLTARVRELEEENARLNAECDDIKQVQFPRKLEAVAVSWKKQLAAEQLNNKLLREALEAVIKVHGYESGIPVEALSTQASTEALDKYVAEKVKEIIESHAPEGRNVTNAQHVEMRHKFVEQIATLSLQRDLAAKMLENCRLLAARHRKEEWAGHIMRFCKDAGLSGLPIRNDSIKESENNKAS